MASGTEMSSVLERWQSSGLSLRGFGAREGVSYPKLLYWRRKLRGEGGSQGKRKRTRRAKTPELVAVEVVEDGTVASPSRSPYSVWLGNGIGIDVPAGFDPGDLRRLVKVLTSC